ncbi:MAG TPA: hypothetical protein VNY36_09745, partial [Bacteroidia bacterium]|nr:hypothetical protein [Bacteroidia bacterium]
MKKYILLTTITVCLLFADSLSSLAQNKNATVKSNIPVWNDDSLKAHHVKLVDPGNAPKYNLDSIVAVSKMSIPIETGKVIIERF